MIDLRPYQESLLADTRSAMRAGCRRPLIVLPTGGGKTRIATRMCQASIARGVFPLWFAVHRRELLTQTAEAFAKADIDVGLVAAGHPVQGDRAVQVVLIDSLPKRMNFLAPPRVIIPDEAHHCVAPKWIKMQAAYPKAFYCGLTATPQRLDGKGLGAHFDQIVLGPPMRWLIDNGYLADYRIFAPPPPSMEGVGHVAGDFNQGQVAEVLAKSTIVGDSIAEYRKQAMGMRTLIRSVSVEASARVAEAFKADGFAAAHLDAKTPEGERRRMFNDFKTGELTHLCNVDLFGEGVDIPGVECLIDLRPTESLTMFLQYIGRMLRPAPGKARAIYLDQVGNTARHGLPDEEREWSLEGRKKKKKPAAVFTCKMCYGTFGKPFRYCPSCGEMVSGHIGSRADPKQVDGELHELDKEMMRRRRYDPQRGRAQTLEELTAYGVAHGYRPGWAQHVFNARMAKRRA